ncbi:unnamed protein product [Ilex paraguariensis]|uniref:At1g61320/AtMIF1 LRR domain-containing protein n=1 Tax=Ilex paraguariensis TaxID=185542 RepID=A0ABC8U894_9AQUA
MGKKLQKKKKSQFPWRDLSHDRRGDSCNYEILSSLRFHIEEERKDDRISVLPDEILLSFLFLIPFKDALKTIALSTRWRDFWNRAALVRHGDIEDIDCAVGDLLLHFDELNPLDHAGRLQFHFSRGLILLAVIGLEKNLRLDFSKGKQEFPRQFGWHLVLNSIDPTHQPPSYATFVKSLNLTSVSYLTNEIVSSLVSNFQSLESLTIARCEGLRSLRVDVLSKLLNLTILDCPHLKSLYIEAYELQSLRYRGPVCWFSLRGVVHLADAMLDCRSDPGYDHLLHKDFDPLVEAIGDVKTLTLCGWMFRAVIHLPSLGFNKLEDLWWIDSSMEEYNIDALFAFLTIDRTSYCSPSSLSKCYNKVGKLAKLRHLKVVKLEGFTEDENVILLKELLLEVFSVEPRIVVATDGSYPRTIVKIPKHQRKNNLKMVEPKSQRRKSLYKFVEELEDNIGLYSKHAHFDL